MPIPFNAGCLCSSENHDMLEVCDILGRKNKPIHYHNAGYAD